jgi:hypothetical protein
MTGTPCAPPTIMTKALIGITVLIRAFALERVTGIEPALSAWEPSDLPSGTC